MAVADKGVRSAEDDTDFLMWGTNVEPSGHLPQFVYKKKRNC